MFMFFNLDGWRLLIGAQNLNQHIVRRCLIWLHPRWWHTKELVQRAKHSKKTSLNLEDNLSSLKNTNKCELYADNRPNNSNKCNFQNSMDYGRITPIIVSALQDAHRKIEQLEQRLADMEAK